MRTPSNHVLALTLGSLTRTTTALCAGWCATRDDTVLNCETRRQCRDCDVCSPPPLPPSPPAAPANEWYREVGAGATAEHDYATALRLALLFYRTQRSGDLRDDPVTPRWRSDAPSFTSDGADVGVDLSGGYFDAGDYVKYGQPAAFSMTLLAWSGVEFEEGFRAAGALDELRNAVRWGADFMLAAATHLDRNCTYYAQVGRGARNGCTEPSCKFDHGFWGRPEDYDGYRFAHQRRTYAIDARTPGAEIWAGASAALAATHMLLRRSDDPVGEVGDQYMDRLLGTSQALYECAVAHAPMGGRLQSFLWVVSPQYKSWGASDELGWAAAWLYDATRLSRYANDFEPLMTRPESKWTYEGFGASWDDVNALAKLKMLTAEPQHPRAAHLHDQMRRYLDKWRECDDRRGEPHMTRGGLCYLLQWAPLRYALTTALLFAVFARHAAVTPALAHTASPTASIVWALGQLHYALGDNPRRTSFVVGYAGADGTSRFPRRPHHRAASCPPASEGAECSEASALCSACDNPWVLHGALVGGPDDTDCWADDRCNYEKNEVSLDYNAPLPGLLACAVVLQRQNGGAAASNGGNATAPVEFGAWAQQLEYRQGAGVCAQPPRRAPFDETCPSGEPSDDNPSCPFDSPNQPPARPSPPRPPPGPPPSSPLPSVPPTVPVDYPQLPPPPPDPPPPPAPLPPPPSSPPPPCSTPQIPPPQGSPGRPSPADLGAAARADDTTVTTPSLLVSDGSLTAVVAPLALLIIAALVCTSICRRRASTRLVAPTRRQEATPSVTTQAAAATTSTAPAAAHEAAPAARTGRKTASRSKLLVANASSGSPASCYELNEAAVKGQAAAAMAAAPAVARQQGPPVEEQERAQPHEVPRRAAAREWVACEDLD